MLGWSIIARAWRSASKRATTWRRVHARLDDLQGDLAADGLGLLGDVDRRPCPPRRSAPSACRGRSTVPGPLGRGAGDRDASPRGQRRRGVQEASAVRVRRRAGPRRAAGALRRRRRRASRKAARSRRAVSSRAPMKIAFVLASGPAMVAAPRVARPHHNARNPPGRRSPSAGIFRRGLGRQPGALPPDTSRGATPGRTAQWRLAVGRRRRGPAAASLHAQPGEVPEIDQPGRSPDPRPASRASASSRASRSSASARGGELGLVEIDPPPAAAALLPALAAGALDQDAAHGLGRGGEEVAAAVPVPGLLGVDQPEVRLVDQGGGLERLAGLLLGQLAGRPICAARRRPGAGAARRPRSRLARWPRGCG